MRLSGLSAFLVLAPPLLAQVAAHRVGEEGPDLKALLNVEVVTASRFAQKSDDAPATVVVVTEEQILRRGYHSLKDLLSDLPDYKVETRSEVEWYNDFTVRGVPGHDKFVILLDGVKISAPTNELIPILDNYPLNLARQVEVVFGPASALYGADAVSGVINIITKEKDGGVEAELRGGDNGSRLGNFLWTQALAAGVKITLSGQWSHDGLPDLSKDYPEFEDFAPQRTGVFNSIFGPMTASGYNREPSFDIRTQSLYGSVQGGGLRFTFFHSRAKTPTSVNNKPGSAIYDESVFVGHQVNVMGLSHSTTAGAFTFASSLQTSEYRLHPGSSFRNAFTGLHSGYKYAESGSVKGEEQVTWAPSEGFTLIGGLSYETFHAVPWSTDLNAPVNTRGAISGTILGTNLAADFFPLNYANLGAYLQGQYLITPDLIGTLGLRYDDNSRYGGTTNPRLGLVWHLNPQHTVKVLYGTAFLAPSPYAAFAHFGSFNSTTDGPGPESFYWRLPNPGLKPIKERSLEVGWRGYLTGTLSISATAFRTELTNLYALADDSTTTHLYNGRYKGLDVAFIEVRTNLGKQSNTGGTLRVDYLNFVGDGIQVNVYLSHSLVDGKIDPKEDGNKIEIGRIAPAITRLGLDCQWRTLSGSLRYTKVTTQRMEALQADGTRITVPGYGVFDFNVRAELTKAVSANLSISNVTNQKYRVINEVGSDSPTSIEFIGAPQDPRRVFLGVGVRF